MDGKQQFEVLLLVETRFTTEPTISSGISPLETKETEGISGGELGSLPGPLLPVENLHWQQRKQKVFHMQKQKGKTQIVYSGTDAYKVFNSLVFDGLAREAIKQAKKA